MRLYLASTSRARLSLLRAAGIEPVVVPSNVDEEMLVREAEAKRGAPLDPRGLVQLLAQAKAEAVVREHGAATIDGLIVGGDSAFVVNGHIYGKPHAPSVARERWHEQRGHQGRLYSGHWVIDHRRQSTTHRGVGEVAVATVHFASDMTDHDVDAYVATGEPLSVAGAFTIEGRSAAYIDRIDGHPSAVAGLSLPVVRKLVAEFGVAWPSLWDMSSLESQSL